MSRFLCIMAAVPLILSFGCGELGIRGKDGKNGADGKEDRSIFGPGGSQGPMGSPGWPGSSGPTGPQGHTGSPGPRGQEGNPGDSMYVTTFSNTVVSQIEETADRIFCSSDYTSNDLQFRVRTRNTFLTINDQRAKTLRECPDAGLGTFANTKDGKITVALCGYKGLFKAGDKVKCTMQMYGEIGREPNLVSLNPNLATAYLTGSTSQPIEVKSSTSPVTEEDLNISIDAGFRKKLDISTVGGFLYRTSLKILLTSGLEESGCLLQCRVKINLLSTDNTIINDSYVQVAFVDFTKSNEQNLDFRYSSSNNPDKITFNVDCADDENFAVMQKPLNPSRQNFEVALDSLPIEP